MEGVLLAGQKGKTMRVRYTGDVDATVTYAKIGEVYRSGLTRALLWIC